MSEEKEYFTSFPNLTVIPWLIWGVVVGLVIAALFYSSRLHAEEIQIPVHVHDSDGVSVRLMGRDCADQTSETIILMNLPQYAERAKAIDSDWRMKDGSTQPFAGCWIELTPEEGKADEPTFILVFSDGQAFALKKSDFLKKRGQSGA